MELSWDIYEVSNEFGIVFKAGCYYHCCNPHGGYGNDEW